MVRVLKGKFIQSLSLLDILENVTYASVFYYEAKLIIEMREKLLTRGGVYILRDFQKGHK